MKITHSLPTMVNPTAAIKSKAAVKPVNANLEFANKLVPQALAHHQLSQLGIAEPTEEQVNAALYGGTITDESDPSAPSTELTGIMTLREQKMGWGRIAKELDMKLGAAVSAYRANANALAVRNSGINATAPAPESQPPVDSGESGSDAVTESTQEVAEEESTTSHA